jgi:hypothetical protein
LEQSSRGWHEGRHDPWPFINYILFILKTAYGEFEERVGQIKSPRGAKTALIEAAVKAFPAEFSLNDLERACPGVSRDMVRRVLRDLQKAKAVVCLGRGPGAAWRKEGITLKRGYYPQKRVIERVLSLKLHIMEVLAWLERSYRQARSCRWLTEHTSSREEI